MNLTPRYPLYNTEQPLLGSVQHPVLKFLSFKVIGVYPPYTQYNYLLQISKKLLNNSIDCIDLWSYLKFNISSQYGFYFISNQQFYLMSYVLCIHNVFFITTPVFGNGSLTFLFPLSSSTDRQALQRLCKCLRSDKPSQPARQQTSLRLVCRRRTAMRYEEINTLRPDQDLMMNAMLPNLHCFKRVPICSRILRLKVLQELD